MKPTLLFAAIVAVMLSSSCGGRNGAALKESDVAMTPNNMDKKNYTPPAIVSGGAESADSTAVDTSKNEPPPPPPPHVVPQSGVPANPDWDKKIIKTAHVTLELKDYNGYNNSIHAKTKAYGAYIAQEQQTETDEQISNEITIKVPVAMFEDMMNSLGGEGIKVVEKSITSEDVTGEVVDTKARMEAKKQVRDQYLALLKQAKTMKDILDVQQEVNGIQEDIESANSRVNYLVHSAAYSTINIKYYQYLNGITAKDAEPTFLRKMGDAFSTGGGIITSVVLFFVSVWPLVLAGIFVLLYVRKRKNTKHKKEIMV